MQKKISEELATIDTMDGIIFEEYCKQLLDIGGFFRFAKFEKTKQTKDYGADIVITLLGNKKICVQCKRSKNNVGLDAIQEVLASKNYYKANYCMVMTNSYFTENARILGLQSDVLMIDRDKLIKLLDMKNAVLEEAFTNKQWKQFLELPIFK